MPRGQSAAPCTKLEIDARKNGKLEEDRQGLRNTFSALSESQKKKKTKKRFSWASQFLWGRYSLPYFWYFQAQPGETLFELACTTGVITGDSAGFWNMLERWTSSVSSFCQSILLSAPKLTLAPPTALVVQAFIFKNPATISSDAFQEPSVFWPI